MDILHILYDQTAPTDQEEKIMEAIHNGWNELSKNLEVLVSKYDGASVSYFRYNPYYCVMEIAVVIDKSKSYELMEEMAGLLSAPFDAFFYDESEGELQWMM